MTVKDLNKMAKGDLAKFIGVNVPDVKAQDKNLFDRIAYTDKQMKQDAKSITKRDLLDLAKEILKLLGDSVKDLAGEPKQTPKLVVENSTKPKLPNSGKGNGKTDKKDQTTLPPQDNKQQQTAGESKTEPPKADNKKTKPATPETVTADSFPAEIEVNGVKATLTHDYHTLDELEAAFANRQVFLAFYWSKTQIKQFNYGSGLLPAPKNGFKDNLDIASLLYISERNPKTCCFALSTETDNMYQVMKDSLEEFDGVRYNMGIEFALYQTEPVTA